TARIHAAGSAKRCAASAMSSPKGSRAGEAAMLDGCAMTGTASPQPHVRPTRRRSDVRRIASVLPVTLLRTAPVQRPGAACVVVAEQIGADRLRQGRIVDQESDVFAGAFAGALPARADLRAIVIALMEAIVRGVLRIRGLGGDDSDFAVEREGVDAPDKAGLLTGEGADL